MFDLLQFTPAILVHKTCHIESLVPVLEKKFRDLCNIKCTSSDQLVNETLGNKDFLLRQTSSNHTCFFLIDFYVILLLEMFIL